MNEENTPMTQNAQALMDLTMTDSPVNSPVMFGIFLKKLKEIEAEINKLSDTKKSYLEWFAGEEKKMTDQILFIRGQLIAYLDAHGEKSLKTPHGSAHKSISVTYQWPSDEVLVSYSEEHGIDYKIKKSPDKNAIKKFVGDHPSIPAPEGFDAIVNHILVVKSPSETKTSTKKKPAQTFALSNESQDALSKGELSDLIWKNT